MKITHCDLCKSVIENDKESISFDDKYHFSAPSINSPLRYDLCGLCVKLVRQATCKKCHGSGTERVRDDEASFREATCGENRTQYRTFACSYCGDGSERR